MITSGSCIVGTVEATSAPKAPSPHQGAMGRLEEEINVFGKRLGQLLERLEPVSCPGSRAKAAESNAAIPPPVAPVVAHADRLTGYVRDHIEAVENALDRLAI
jgi:hypothetical protein